MQLTIPYGSKVTVSFADTDGEITISFADGAITVHSDLPDDQGREGVIYNSSVLNMPNEQAEALSPITLTD